MSRLHPQRPARASPARCDGRPLARRQAPDFGQAASRAALVQKKAHLAGGLGRPGGERGIRTLGTGEPVRRISNPVHSTTLPSLRVLMRGFALGEASDSSGSSLDDRLPTQVRTQGHRHPDAAVGLLVVLQHRHQRAAHGQAAAVADGQSHSSQRRQRRGKRQRFAGTERAGICREGFAANSQGFPRSRRRIWPHVRPAVCNARHACIVQRSQFLESADA